MINCLEKIFWPISLHNALIPNPYAIYGRVLIIGCLAVRFSYVFVTLKRDTLS